MFLVDMNIHIILCLYGSLYFIKKNIMIVDCFNIYNEKEILHLRLDYLYDVVDRFVIVESLDSHSKKVRKNKYMFEENIELYEPYMDKITYLKLDNLPFEGDSGTDFYKWKNENYQKNYCSEGIKDLNDNDWILFSDVDEIPNKEIIMNLKNHNGISRFVQKLFYYHVNIQQNQLWGGTVALQKKEFKSMMHLRENRTNEAIQTFQNGGWHYSYMGGPDRILEKMKSYAESNSNSQYCNIDNIHKSIQSSMDVLGRKDDMFTKKMVNIDHDGMAPCNIGKIIKLYPYLLKQLNISYVCLIYKSTSWLKFVYNQILKYINLNNNEFFFVANDACEDVLDYLKYNDIPHYVHNNTEEQRKEWYINNVYRAYNLGGKMAKGNYIIFLNSDMAFSLNWSEKLIDTITADSCVASRLVERGVLRSGMHGIEKNFGDDYHNYRENDFIDYAKSIEENILYDSGLYMPLLISKKHLETINYYPEGNIVPGSDIFNPIYAKKGEPCIPGDKVFMEKLRHIGVYHKTNFNSIIYHFQQGEISEVIQPKKPMKKEILKNNGWLVNDTLTCIPGTKTFWHFLLDTFPELEDKTNGYTNFGILADNIESELNVNKPKYIIRNATYFRKISTDVYTISILQDNHTKSQYILDQQKTVLAHSNLTIVNSKYVYDIYKNYIPNEYKIVPLGTNFDVFKPSNNRNASVLPDSILFIGSSLIYPKGFNRMQKIIMEMQTQNFCLIMKDNFNVQQLPFECHNRVKIFNCITENEIVPIINSCLMGICTSYEETQHLSGIEICACNKPMVATNVGVYYDCHDSEEWGIIANDTNFIEKINYVLGNLDKFAPREYLMHKGYTMESCKKSWMDIIKKVEM